MAFDFVAVNADYAARVRASLAAQACMDKLLGARVTQVLPGLLEIEAPLGADVLQAHGNSHGMVLSAVADSATGYAAQTLLGAEFEVVTVEFKVNYLTPAFGPQVRALGRVMPGVATQSWREILSSRTPSALTVRQNASFCISPRPTGLSTF